MPPTLLEAQAPQTIGIYATKSPVSTSTHTTIINTNSNPPKVSLEVLRDLTNQSLERQLPDQQVSALLVLADLPKSHCARMRLLHTTCCSH
jgi:hypothetical protein